MKRKRIILILLVFVTAVVLASCRSEERFGQRRAPKDCNCTKW